MALGQPKSLSQFLYRGKLTGLNALSLCLTGASHAQSSTETQCAAVEVG
jgi:hypothetical protein